MPSLLNVIKMIKRQLNVSLKKKDFLETFLDKIYVLSHIQELE